MASAPGSVPLGVQHLMVVVAFDELEDGASRSAPAIWPGPDRQTGPSRRPGAAAGLPQHGLVEEKPASRHAVSCAAVKSVLAIAGSLRRGSFNRSLLRAAVACAPPSMSIRIHDGLDSIPLFDADLEAGLTVPDPVRDLRCAVASADGLLVATPEYNHSFPGVLKNAVDWLSRAAPEQVLAGKPVALVGASSGRWGTRLAQAALRQVLYATESVVLPRPALFLGEASRLFDAAGGLTDPEAREQLSALLLAFGDWIDLVRRPRAGGR